MIEFERTPRANPGINMVPLINVVFLLLLFFMLAGTLRTVEVVDVSVPESSAGRDDGKRPIVVLVAADGGLAINDRIVEPDALTRHIVALAAGDGEPPRVVMKADADADSGALLAAMRGVAAAGVSRIGIATRAPSGR